MSSFAPKADLGDMRGVGWGVLTTLSRFLVTGPGARAVVEPMLC